MNGFKHEARSLSGKRITQEVANHQFIDRVKAKG